MEYKVLVVGCNDIKKLGENLGDQFSLLAVATAQETFHLPDLKEYKLAIVVIIRVNHFQISLLLHHTGQCS